MMSVATEPRSDEPINHDQAYRALSATAVASLVAGVLSVAALLDWGLGLIPLVGILLGVSALWQIRRRPDELTGGRLAMVGVMLSAILLVAGWARLTYAYMTEVPEGYVRLSYDSLQPDTSVPGEMFPPTARELDGKHVYIKGFVYPGKQTTGIKKFVLCRDNGTCCFGGQPKLTDMIEVTLAGSLQMEYATRPFAVGGTFHLQPTRTPNGQFAVLYHLEADYLK